ncbi:MAG: tetratricopeptide repeat protein [Myxococcales bacterium]|nr:tetratricopeptide repeat protein [Myxococcota bacterium]MDW8284170.1 tetratricopeptide repeat protein [Myxococcales bacterium]
MSIRSGSRRALWPLAVGCLLLGCGAAQRPKTPSAAAVSKEPPADKLPPRRIESEEEADSARQDLDYLGDPGQRAPLMRELLRYHVAHGEEALERGHPEEAFEALRAALQLFPPAALQDPLHPPEAPGLQSLAHRLEATFRRRGAYLEVTCALMVQRTLAPQDPGPQRRYDEMAAWLAGLPGSHPPWRRGAGEQAWQEPAGRPAFEVPLVLVRSLEATARIWSAWPVLQELDALYLAEAGGPGQGQPRGLRELLGSGGRSPTTSLPAFRMARLYLRVPRPQDALRAIRRLEQVSRLSPPERSLLAALEVAFAPGADPAETVKLAMAMAQSSEDADVGLAICEDLARRHPRAVVAHLCVGELAGQQHRTGLAIRALEQARALKPEDRMIWERLSQLYLARLSNLVGDERTAELEGALRHIESFQERMVRAFPDASVGPGLAAALAEVGRGYYNAGRVPEAMRYLERSIQAEPNSAALELLGTIQLRRGQVVQALATLERARAVDQASHRGDPLFKVYFRAHLGRLIADAMDLLPQEQARAAEVRQAALRDWDTLLASERLLPERRAEAELERGRLLYELGDREAALGAFQAAMDAVPEEGSGRSQGQIYADIISFLVQRGEVTAALEAYHRAMARPRLVEYLKVYCSLWINDLLLRAGQPEDPLATAFLRSLRGGQWYAELARWATGQQSEEQMLARADTVARQAEAHFYLGMHRLRSGRIQEGQELLRKVLASDMMAFFEYEMAALYLRQGAPTQPVLKPPPRKEPKRPPGSI